MTHRFEGRNIEEALGLAAAELGVDPQQLTHRVLVEKRGFLGGIKRVVIEAELAPAAPPASAEPSVVPPAPQPAAPVTPAPSSRARPDPEGKGGRDRGRSGRRQPRGDARPGRGAGGSQRGPRREASDLQPGDFSRFANEELPPQEQESPAALAVRTWCEKVLSIGRFEIYLRTRESGTRIDVTLFGPDSPAFLDRNGELLDALQVLANKALAGRKVEQEIELDCDGFKLRREESIVQQARTIADRVRSGKVEQLLPAMPPAERRIVHAALQDDPDVATISRGEGFFKRVAIIPRTAATEPQP